MKRKALFYVFCLMFFMLSCSKDKDFGKKAPKESELIGNWRLVSIEANDKRTQELLRLNFDKLKNKICGKNYDYQLPISEIRFKGKEASEVLINECVSGRLSSIYSKITYRLRVNTLVVKHDDSDDDDNADEQVFADVSISKKGGKTYLEYKEAEGESIITKRFEKTP